MYPLESLDKVVAAVECKESNHDTCKESNHDTCECCKNLSFSKHDFYLYTKASQKGRRGNVLSLHVDQSISYIKDLDNSDQYLVFKFVDAKQK